MRRDLRYRRLVIGSAALGTLLAAVAGCGQPQSKPVPSSLSPTHSGDSVPQVELQERAEVGGIQPSSSGTADQLMDSAIQPH